MERFWSKVDRTGGEQACWNWLAGKDSHGYGTFRLYGADKSPINAHRVAWQLTHGEIVAGVFICHTCDNPACVNPGHLFIGSPKMNFDDMRRKNRQQVRLPVMTFSPESLSYMRGLSESAAAPPEVRVLLAAVLERLHVRSVK